MNLSRHQEDRRKEGRTAEDRRDLRTRVVGSWTEAERSQSRRVAEMREEYHDRHAITIIPDQRPSR